jgi:hypothetical protein
MIEARLLTEKPPWYDFDGLPYHCVGLWSDNEESRKLARRLFVTFNVDAVAKSYALDHSHARARKP